jgi:hypothetical protein
MQHLIAQDCFAPGIKDHDVGISADGQRALSWVQPEAASWFCAAYFNPALKGKPPGADTVAVKQGQACLDAWSATRDAGEIIKAPDLLCFVEEGTMIGCDGVDLAGGQASPKGLAVNRGTGWGSHHKLGSLKARALVLGLIEE